VPEAQRANAGLLYDRLRWWRRRGKAVEGGADPAPPAGRPRRPELWWKEQQLAIRELVEDGAAARAYQVAAATGSATASRSPRPSGSPAGSRSGS
jgi:soluble lytic murein transglycosylase